MTAAWVVWLVVILVGFTVLEWRAVKDPAVGDTLTEHIRSWLHTRQHNPAGRLGRVIFLVLIVGFPAWFAVHILVPGFV